MLSPGGSRLRSGRWTDARWEGSRRPSFKEKESEIEIWGNNPEGDTTSGRASIVTGTGVSNSTIPLPPPFRISTLTLPPVLLDGFHRGSPLNDCSQAVDGDPPTQHLSQRVSAASHRSGSFHVARTPCEWEGERPILTLLGPRSRGRRRRRLQDHKGGRVTVEVPRPARLTRPARRTTVRVDRLSNSIATLEEP
jgi:hypothetical protein